VATSQTGVADPAVHADVSCDVHWTHFPAVDPVVWQRGSCVPGHATAAHWVLLLHGRHVPVGVLQMGVPPEQSALVTQPTHVAVAWSHTGWLPGQSVLAWHATHWP
jgi:hypothetical protein